LTAVNVSARIANSSPPRKNTAANARAHGDRITPNAATTMRNADPYIVARVAPQSSSPTPMSSADRGVVRIAS